jgi:hypothetical protein
MLEYAKKHENELKNLFYDIRMDFSFKYCFLTPWREDVEIPGSTYNEHTFVSLRDDKIIGYISCNVTISISDIVDSFFTPVHSGYLPYPRLPSPPAPPPQLRQ